MASNSLRIDRHTEHPVFAWRVVHALTGETWGYGLSEADAARLRDQLVASGC